MPTLPLTQRAATSPARSRNLSPRALLRNVLTNYATLIVGSLLSLVTTPLLLHSLGTNQFGTFSLLGATTGYLMLLEVGLGITTTNRIAAIEEAGTSALADVANTAIALYRLVGFGALAVTCAFAPFFASLFAVPEALHGQAFFAFLGFGVAMSINASIDAYTAILLGTGRMYVVVGWGFAVSTGTTVAVVGLASAGATLPILSLVAIVGAVANLVVLRVRTQHAIPGIDFKLSRAKLGTAKGLLVLSWRNAVSNLAGSLAFSSDLTLVGLILGVRADAAYAIALRAVSFCSSVVISAAMSLGPSHANRVVTGTLEQRFNLYCVGNMLALIPTLAVGLILLFDAPGLLQLWLGNYPRAAATLLPLSSLVMICQAPIGQANQFLQAAEQLKFVMRISLLSAAVNVIASVILTTQVGIEGPILGSIIAVCGVDLVVLPWKACRVLGQPFRRLLRRLIVPLLLPCAVMAALLAVGHVIASHGPLLIPIVGSAAVAYVAVLWYSSVFHELRDQGREALH